MINRKYGNKAGPSVFVLHIQLLLFNWFKEQLAYDETEKIPAPEFSEGLRNLAMNNVQWLPNFDDIPALSGLVSEDATPVTPLGGTRTPANATGGGTERVGNGTGPGREDRQPAGRRVQNPHRNARFTGETPFAVKVRTMSVRAAIAAAGAAAPMVRRNNEEVATCVSWHAKGMCYENCDRKADHGRLTVAEAEAFHTWCAAAYA